MNTDLTGGYYRRIYAGYLTSKKINAVSMGAEAWFWRLHSIADDYGNLHGEPSMLCSLAAPRRSVSAKQAEEWTNELLIAQLIYSYCSDEDVYLHIISFEAKQPAGKNGKRVQKCPMHPDSLPILPGESKKIQINPGESSANRKILTDHYYDNHHNETTLPEAADAAPARKAKPRSEKQIERDSLFDAIKVAFYPSGTSKADEKLISQTVTALKAKKALPEEVSRRLSLWPSLYPDAAPLSPPGLAKHWDSLNGRSGVRTPKPRRNEGIENEKDDHVYLRALKKWQQENGQ